MANKDEILKLLNDNLRSKDDIGLSHTITVLYLDGADSDFTHILLQLLECDWHILHEDIVDVLELIKDPISVDKLYNLALNVPEDDECCSLGKKCIWALSAINTEDSRRKIKLLCNSQEPIIRETAILYFNE
ncbi:hypothetical protein [Vallitalea sp.]|uniref:hypothetical protein n=1 Tax=Vallitalea sp. TaxID=1882829 RepID=UPI0025ED79CF|nr:hypothetical protein [Vallitalea sp.]MCT4685776.1 hypothetical protein [Vallitalea sp.]